MDNMELKNVVKKGIESRPKQTPNLTRKAYLNSIASLLDYGAKVSVSLLVTPVLVAGLGTTLFGVWQILNRLVGYISAADGRPTQALKWVIANQQSSNDHLAKRRAVGSAIGVWLVLLPFLLVIGAIVVWLSPTIVKVSDEMAVLVWAACFLLVVNLVLTILVSVPESVLRGMNLGYKRMGVMAGLNVVGGLLTVGAIHLQLGLIGIALAQVLVTIMTGVLFWYLIKVYVPWFGVALASWREIRQFFGISIWYSAWDLINLLLTGSDVVILGWILTSSAVASYVLTNYCVNTMVGIMGVVVGAAVPGLGGLVGKKKYANLIEIRNEMMLLSCLLVTVVGAPVLMWNRSFVALWVDSEHYAGQWVNLLLVLIAVQLLFIRNDAFLINLTLNVRRKAIIGLCAALLSIGLAFPLTTSLGMIGLCVAVLMGRTVMTIAYPAIVGAFLGMSAMAQIRVIMRPLLVMVMVFAFAVYVGREVVATDWVTLFIYAGFSAGIAFLVQFLIGFSSSQRLGVLRRARCILGLPILNRMEA